MNIEPHVVSSKEGQPNQTGGFRAAKAVARDRGVSDVTVWRWARLGWIKTANISGRPYVDLASLARFDQRVTAGEFAKPPAGAARKSAEERAKKEGKAA
jgi:hypothetical protein